LIESTTAIRKSTDARQDYTIGSRNAVGVAGDDNRLAISAFARCSLKSFGN
jgi:hypothetical protein